MNMEQFIGCVVRMNGRPAQIVGARDCYEGCWFLLRYTGGDPADDFRVDAYDPALLRALPDPRNGILKRRKSDVLYVYKDVEYELGSQPYEPCLYIRENGAIFRTLHNAFTVYDLPEFFAAGRTLRGIDGKIYDEAGFRKVLAAAIDSSRSEMDFPFAARLARAQGV